MYRELLIGCGAKRTKDLRLPTAEEIILREKGLSEGQEIKADGRVGTEFKNLVTLDNNEAHKPDILADISSVPWNLLPTMEMQGYRAKWGETPLESAPHYEPSNLYEEIHAYEVLEHIGRQGDYRLFFDQFSEFWRILKPDGLLFASCPAWHSMWAWGDPSHTRVLTRGTLSFLSQANYARDVGRTPMSDFRHIYKADFEVIVADDSTETFLFVLRARK